MSSSYAIGDCKAVGDLRGLVQVWKTYDVSLRRKRPMKSYKAIGDL